MRLGAPAMCLVPGVAALAVLAWLLTLKPSDFAGAHLPLMAGPILSPRSSGCRQPRASGTTVGTLMERCHAWLAGQSSCLPRLRRYTRSYTCVLQPSHLRCNDCGLLNFMRSLLVLVLLGGMLIFTSLGPAAAQIAALQAMTATPCCPDDCPPKVECGPACAALMQCRSAPVTMVLEIGFRQSADTYGAMKFALSDVPSDYSVVQSGLRRPPRL